MHRKLYLPTVETAIMGRSRRAPVEYARYSSFHGQSFQCMEPSTEGILKNSEKHKKIEKLGVLEKKSDRSRPRNWN